MSKKPKPVIGTILLVLRGRCVWLRTELLGRRGADPWRSSRSTRGWSQIASDTVSRYLLLLPRDGWGKTIFILRICWELTLEVILTQNVWMWLAMAWLCNWPLCIFVGLDRPAMGSSWSSSYRYCRFDVLACMQKNWRDTVQIWSIFEVTSWVKRKGVSGELIRLSDINSIKAPRSIKFPLINSIHQYSTTAAAAAAAEHRLLLAMATLSFPRDLAIRLWQFCQ